MKPQQPPPLPPYLLRSLPSPNLRHRHYLRRCSIITISSKKPSLPSPFLTLIVRRRCDNSHHHLPSRRQRYQRLKWSLSLSWVRYLIWEPLLSPLRNDPDKTPPAPTSLEILALPSSSTSWKCRAIKKRPKAGML